MTSHDEAIHRFKSASSRVFFGGASAGLFGAAWGATIATLRGENRLFYASSIGANFFLLGATYSTLEECIVDKIGYSDSMTAACSGATTGGLYAGLIGGRMRGIQGAVAGSIVAITYRLGSGYVEKWRLRKGIERYRQKYGCVQDNELGSKQARQDIETSLKTLEFPSILPKSIRISDEEIEQRVIDHIQEIKKRDDK